MDKKLNRRSVLLAWAGALPGMGLASYLIPVWWRYLFPTMQPWGFFSQQVLGKEEPQRVDTIETFNKPWDHREFVFIRQTRIFNSEGYFNTMVPGFMVAIPQKEGLPTDAAVPNPREDLRYVAYSRICPHLGCVFTYQITKEAVKTQFNYGVPIHDHHFACPCHLSVYDLEDLIPLPGQTDTTGENAWLVGPKVVSGPAPRPPRPFMTEVKEDGGIYVIQLEGGGLS